MLWNDTGNQNSYKSKPWYPGEHQNSWQIDVCPPNFGITCSHTIACFYPNRSKLRQALATALPGNRIVKSSPICKLRTKKRETRTTGWRLYVPKMFEGVKSGIWRNHNLIQPPLVSHKQLRCCAHPISFKVASIDTCSVSSLSSTWTSKPASRALAQWHAAIPFPKQSCCCALGRYTQTGGCPSLIKP